MSIHQILLAATAAVLLGSATPAQAGVRLPPPQAGIYDWSGMCTDCPLNGDPSPASATLVVPDVGDMSTWSFTYRSSNFEPDLVSTSILGGHFGDLLVPDGEVLVIFRTIPRDVPHTTHQSEFWDFHTGLTPTGGGNAWQLNEGDDIGVVDNGWTYSPLSAVPEASSWVMALAGLGVLGPLLRRRRADSSAA